MYGRGEYWARQAVLPHPPTHTCPSLPPHLPPPSCQRADALDFDPEDVTKIWPEDLFPLQPVGRMVLNRNPDNFFNENEQLAFCPALVVPGVHYSNDKLLQASCRLLTMGRKSDQPLLSTEIGVELSHV